jgi:hypothetical protein
LKSGIAVSSPILEPLGKKCHNSVSTNRSKNDRWYYDKLNSQIVAKLCTLLRVTLAVKLAVVLILFVTLFASLNTLLPSQAAVGSGDESFYVGRAMQNLEFLTGTRSIQQVFHVRDVVHPFTSELIIGVSLALQGQTFSPPSIPWNTNMTKGQLVASRQSALFVALLGLVAVVFVALDMFPLAGIAAALFLLSSPGFLEFSMADEPGAFSMGFIALVLAGLYFYVVKKKRTGLWLSALFLGLAFGAKTAWDTVMVAIVLVIAVMSVEKLEKGTLPHMLRSLSMVAVIGAATYAITSPATLIGYFAEGAPHLQLSGIISPSDIITTQSLVQGSGYSIFLVQLPMDICVFLLSLFIATMLTLMVFKRRSFHIEPDRAFLYVILITFFAALALVFGAFAYENGENFVRSSMYEAMLISVLGGYLYQRNRLFGSLFTINVIALCGYSLVSFVQFITPIFLATGRLSGHILPALGIYANVIGWPLLAWSLVTIGVLGIVLLRPMPSFLASMWTQYYEWYDRFQKDRMSG